MLGDPKKLRTRDGFGFLVSWRDRWRNLDEGKAQALTERLLDEPGNLEALQEGLGRPSATREEIGEWLAGALAAESIVAVRTRREPPTLDAPAETDLRDLLGPTPGEDEIRPQSTTWLELRVVDELGEPVAGVPIRIRAGDEVVVETNADGVARLEEASTSFGSARIGSASALHDVLRQRWSQDRDTPWLDVEGTPHLTVSGPAEPLPEVGLQGKTPHTLVMQPRVGRARIVGSVFDTNKAFVLPDALGLLRDVAALYDEHRGASMLVVGHTDTSGEPELNLALSLDRARAVSAYLTDDVDAWLAFYDDAVLASQRWGTPEDALLLERALWGQGQIPTGDPVGAYQEARGLTVDGDLGPNTRCALIEDYMSLDGSTLPSSITPVVHGCGEGFPLAEDGETLDVNPPDGVDDPTDRRVEVLFFDPPLGVLPEPAGETSEPGDGEYGIWSRRARYTRDMLVVRPLALAVRVVDEETGEPIKGALVSLQGVDLLGTGAGAATDQFGVRTFINVVAGAHHVRAEKPGYGGSTVEHVVLATAAATVVPVTLEPERAVKLALSVRSPDGALIAFAEGATVSLVHDGAAPAQGKTTEEGGVTLKASQRTGTATMSLSFGGTPCLLQAPGGALSFVSLDDALSRAAAGSRFIRLPDSLELPDPRVVVDARVPAEVGTFAVSSLIDASRDRPVSVELAPTWEHVAFTFFERHHGRGRTVPGPSAEGEPALVMTGHVGGVEYAHFHTAWPIVRDGRTMHSLAWFLEQGGVPTDADPIRMQCPQRTYVVSSREAPAELRLEVLPASAPIVDAPNPDRLLYYDVPPQWHCDRYFARRATDGPGSQQPYLDLARQTALSSPVVVSLDDVVVMRNDGAGGRSPVPIETEFTVLDNKLEVYKPNNTDPEGYGEPYFTHKDLLKPAPGSGSVPPWLLLDTAGFTRALVYRQIFDVFDARTGVEDGEVPVGARVAYAPFDGDAPDEEFSGPFFHLVSRLQIEAPGDHIDETSKSRSGRSRAAILRCCASESADTEVLSTLQVFRVFFEFFPSGVPPAGGKSLIGTEQASVIALHGPRLRAQALHRAAARWNGTEAQEHSAQLRDPLDGTLKPVHEPISTRPPSSVFGERKDHICRHRVLFQRDDVEAVGSPALSDLHIKLWLDVRSSMSGSSVSDWDFADLAAHRVFSVVAHEIGHALGLPDEYGETSGKASLGGVTFVDKSVPEGRPFMFDVHDYDDAFPNSLSRKPGAATPTSSIMSHSGSPRARHYLPLAQWAKGLCSLPGCVSVHSSLDEVGDPAGLSRSPFEPELRRAGVTLGGPTIFDAFLYDVGRNTHLGRRFRNPDGAGADAVLVLRTRIEVESGASYGRARGFVGDLQKTFERFSRKAFANISASRGLRDMNVAVVWSPSVLWRRYPKFVGKSKLRAFNAFLSSLSFRDQSGTDYEVSLLGDLKEAESALLVELEQNLQFQKDLEDRIEIFRETDPTGNLSKAATARLEERRAEEADLRISLKALKRGEPPQDGSREEYESLTAAISKEYPPHVVLRPETGLRVELLDSEATPKVTACPKTLASPGIRFRMQALWAKLLGASTGRTRLSDAQLEVLVSAVFEGSEFRVVE